MPQAGDARFMFEIEGLAATLRVARFDGWEAISGLFELAITVLSEDGALDIAALVGKRASLTLDSPSGLRRVHGIVLQVAQADQGKKLTAYDVMLVPAATTLTLGLDHRIFQDLTAVEIAKQVFEGAGLDASEFRFSVQGSLKKREYCVQYRESNWAFVSRLFEEEGIYTYLEHGDDQAVLVACDASTSAAPPVEVDSTAFRAPTGALGRGDSVSRFQVTEGMHPGSVTLRDYNFTKPTLSLESNAQASVFGALEQYEYPGDYDEPSGGSRIATLRLQRWNAAKRVADGESTFVALAPGYTLTLSDHPRDDLNVAWLVTHVEHHGVEPTLGEASGESTEVRYDNRFRAIPADVPYRPPLTTPRPSIRGIQTAIVTGPSGEEIHTDEYGRIKVQFHWDRLGKKDDKSSCWIRVAQVWAGGAWGAMHIPRIGHEVIVEFLEGDPDRPIVTGRVYHGTNVPPYTLPSEKTKSTVKSNSSPGGEGSNELRFEDKKGKEEIYLHGQKDWTIAIENDKNQQIRHDETLAVTRHRTKQIGGDQKETVSGTDTISIQADRIEEIAGQETVTIAKDATRTVSGAQSVTVTKSATVQIGDKLEASVGKDLVLSVSGAQSITVAKDQSESVGKDKKTEVSGGFTLTVQKDLTSKTTGDHAEDVGKNRTFVVGEKLSIECGDAKVTILKNGDVTVDGKNVTIKGSGPVKIEGSKIDVKSEGAVNVEASGAVKVKGSTVGVN